MADFTHKELLEGLGNSAAGFSKNVANGAANFACSLYRQYPWALTFGDWGNYKKGFWDEMCAQRPGGLPVQAAPPFTGGQCDGVKYAATISWSNTTFGEVRSYSAPFEFWGPAPSTNVVAQGPSGSGLYTYLFYLRCRGTGGNPPGALQDVNIASATSADQGSATFTISNVRRVDGQPDTCGNIKTDFPQTPIPDAARSTTITVNTVDNTVYNIPVTFNLPSSNNKYNLDLDVGDLHLTFDFGGVSFSSNPVSNQLNKVYNRSETVNNNVSNLAQNFTSFTNNSNNVSVSWSGGNFETGSKAGSSAKDDEDKPSNLAYVTLDLTQIPRNAKSQEGEQALDIFYAGWFQFVSDGYYYPRQPVHFEKSVFKAPPGATSYSYTLYKGFLGEVTEYRV